MTASEFRNELVSLGTCFCPDGQVPYILNSGRHAPDCHADERWVEDFDAMLASVVADAEARGRQHGLLAACMWTLGEKESYENHPHRRAIQTLKWDAFDRGRWLGIVNGLDALERLDPTPRAPSDTTFVEASDGR